MRRSGLPGLLVWRDLFIWPALLLLLVLVACNSSEEPADPLVAEGKQLFKKNCTSCHSIRPDLKITGPSLYGVASRGGERMAGLDATEYIRLSITAPGDFIVEGFSNLMQPDFEEKLSQEELDAVIAYLMTLE
jgi:mono/diheme cytochrome c family protein